MKKSHCFVKETFAFQEDLDLLRVPSNSSQPLEGSTLLRIIITMCDFFERTSEHAIPNSILVRLGILISFILNKNQKHPNKTKE